MTNRQTFSKCCFQFFVRNLLHSAWPEGEAEPLTFPKRPRVPAKAGSITFNMQAGCRVLSSFQLDAIEGGIQLRWYWMGSWNDVLNASLSTISLEETRCAQVSRHHVMPKKFSYARVRRRQWLLPARKFRQQNVYSAPFHHGLVGGFKYFLFSPLPGEIIQFDNIFQMGWNHQLVDPFNACNSYRVSAIRRWYLGACHAGANCGWGRQSEAYRAHPNSWWCRDSHVGCALPTDCCQLNLS